MSKRLVAVHNYTDKKVILDSRRNEKHSAVGWQQEFAPKLKTELQSANPMYDIPDNSDSGKYFNSHRVDVYITNPRSGDLPDFCYWNDDRDDYKIKYCREVHWQTGTSVMPDGEQGGDGSRIILHVSEPKPGQYQLSAIALEDRGKVKIAEAFRNFKNTTGMRAGQKYTTSQIQTLMQHPSFGAVKDNARDNGFKSIALVAGGEGSFVVGGEVCTGVLMGLNGGGSYFFRSEAVSIGAQEGGAAFVGTYLSTEDPSEVGGLEFFADIELGMGLGFGFSMFTTLGHGSGFLSVLTNGEEVELSVGVGLAQTSKIS